MSFGPERGLCGVDHRPHFGAASHERKRRSPLGMSRKVLRADPDGADLIRSAQERDAAIAALRLRGSWVFEALFHSEETSDGGD